MELCGFPPLAVIWAFGQADEIGMAKQLPPASDDGLVAMQLLADGVPLRLLLDLAAPNGPDSEFIADAERAASR